MTKSELDEISNIVSRTSALSYRVIVWAGNTEHETLTFVASVAQRGTGGKEDMEWDAEMCTRAGGWLLNLIDHIEYLQEELDNKNKICGPYD